MKNEQYKDLAKQAEEALRAFRKIQQIQIVMQTLGEVLDQPASGIIRIQFELEIKDKPTGMISRRMFSFAHGDLFFERTVREFRSVILHVQAEASETFDKL